MNQTKTMSRQYNNLLYYTTLLHWSEVEKINISISKCCTRPVKRLGKLKRGYAMFVSSQRWAEPKRRSWNERGKDRNENEQQHVDKVGNERIWKGRSVIDKLLENQHTPTITRAEISKIDYVIWRKEGYLKQK